MTGAKRPGALTLLRALSLAALLTGAWMPAVPRDTTQVPDDQTEWEAGLACTGHATLPLVQNVIDAKWSPDSKMLALTAGLRVPSTESPTGWREEEFVYTLSVRTGKLTPIGVGIRPEWSGTGAYLSFWPREEDLRVVRLSDGKAVGKILASIPEVRWVGDTMYYVLRREIRAWTAGDYRTVSRFDKDMEPAYPLDDVYFSGDATHLTLTRYSLDGKVERFVGDTATATLDELDVPGATWTEWSPSGSTLLVRYPNRLDLRDMRSAEGGVRTASLASFPGPVASWTADGRSVLIGRVSPTVPAGNAFDAFGVWGAPQSQTLALLPNLLGARSFSPDGRYFVGVSRDRVDTTRLELYRCGPWSDDEWNMQGDPSAEARLQSITGDGRRFVRPVAGDVAQFQTQYHSGVDFAAPVGSIITAADAGFVSAIGWAPTGVGGYRVCVNHGGGLESCYHHTSSALVALGQRVVRGQPIALVGMTGASTGPHLHWEVKLNGKIVDPLAR